MAHTGDVDLPESCDLAEVHPRFVLAFPFEPSFFDAFGVAVVTELAVLGEGGVEVTADVKVTAHLLGELLRDLGVALEVTLQLEHQGLKVVDCGL